RAAIGHDGHQALALELAQRLAHRHGREAEALGGFGDLDAFARSVVIGDDRLAYLQRGEIDGGLDRPGRIRPRPALTHFLLVRLASFQRPLKSGLRFSTNAWMPSS